MRKEAESDRSNGQMDNAAEEMVTSTYKTHDVTSKHLG